MPKQIPEAVRQVIFRLVAEAFRNDRKLSLDDLYGKLLPNEFGLPLPVGRTKVWSLQKEALGEIKVPNALPDPSWSSSPAEWNPQAYPFLLALNRICLLGQAEGPPSNINVPERRELSAREADWGAKLYVALGGAPIGLSYRLISMFVNRDIVKEIYEYPIVIDDLVAYLAYKPWESSEASETYNLACRLGKIPSLGNMPLVAIDDEFEEPTWTTGVKSTAEITASETIEADLIYLEAQLTAPEIQTWNQLQNLAERAQIVKQAALEMAQAIRDSRIGDDGTGAIDSR